MRTDARFLDDNARSHRALLVQNYLESETIPQMAWPARSPVLNPIEHVWDMLGRRIAARAPTSLYYKNGHYCHNKRLTTLFASMHFS
ncbi:hypothetical protein AVEN_25566-1 [Araneus ventricosus]|uniref:Tc1-like transposase DDE domain-containing protein n=1 Tax=Araneus ventricosus TaxID=182803 RepID=A0A4Y2L6P1_ARAVE|nr:hypothetical protein AVEN_25566-1 [Araneus ventricosus]